MTMIQYKNIGDFFWETWAWVAPKDAEAEVKKMIDFGFDARIYVPSKKN